MSESIENMRVIAILGMTTKPTYVGLKIIKQNTTLNLLVNSGDNLIDPAEIILQRAHISTLIDKETAMTGGPVDKTNQRNLAFNIMISDRKKNMAVVQAAADVLNNPELAADYIIRNGYEIKQRVGSHSIPDISVVNKPNVPGTLVATSKSPGRNINFSIDWMYSVDNGATWIMWHSTPVVKTEIPNFATGARVIIRRRFIIGSNAPEGCFSQPSGV